MYYLNMLWDYGFSLMVAAGLLCLFALVNKIYRSMLISENYGNLAVLITGCDTGFGHKCATQLDTLGFNVYAACLTQDKVKELKSKCSSKVTAFQMDVTSEESVKEGFNLVKNSLSSDKGLWAIINNAGVVGSFGACEWFNKSHYQETINVNLLGVIAVTNTFLPLVRKSKGRIVNMASVVGRFSTIPAPYTVSKFCVEAYTDCLRREVAKMGVTVHTLEPGGYQTNITDYKLHSKTADKVFQDLSPELQDYYGKNFPTKLTRLVRIFFYVLVSKSLNEVTDAYIHAVTARFPKTRYVIGFNANILFRPLALLPTWLADICVIIPYPKPQGCI